MSVKEDITDRLFEANQGAANDSINMVSNDTNAFPFYVASGIVFFAIVNYLTRFMVPETVTKNFQSRWKWRNVLTSFIHSFITGTWAPLAFYVDPSIGNDMIYSFNTSIHVLVSFSVGYFIYDFFDMFIYHKKRSTYELLLHHFMVILCYTIAAASKTYVSYAALSLVVEINSIFLHARQLFIIAGVPKSRLAYRNNALLNVATFVLFRILLLGWMTRWLTLHRDDVPIIFFTVGSLGLATIVTMNIILFYRVLMGDFFNTKNSMVNVKSSSSSATSQDTSPTKNGFHTSIVRSLADDHLNEKKCQ